MIAKEEHETDEEHERHKHKEEDMELCRPIWQVPLGERNRRRRNLRKMMAFKKGIIYDKGFSSLLLCRYLCAVYAQLKLIK